MIRGFPDRYYPSNWFDGAGYLIREKCSHDNLHDYEEKMIRCRGCGEMAGIQVCLECDKKIGTVCCGELPHRAD